MVTFLAMFLGCAVGAWLCYGVFGESVGLAGALFGLICGWLFARTLHLSRRIDTLDARLQALSGVQQSATVAPAARATQDGTTPAATRPADVPPPIAPAADVPANAAYRLDERSAAIERAATSAVGAGPATAGVEIDRAAPPVVPSSAPSPPRVLTPQGAPITPRAPIDNAAWLWLKRWFSEGNVPVKVGVIVLFFGVAYLFKYAADQGWLHVSIEFRLLGVAVAALGALGFAWRRRESHRAFALALQGGAIGVLILTVFAAYRLYPLLPAPLAFGLLIVIVAGAGVLAVLQDSLALAVLAIVGGFLAPILISTGSGNHVALFSYYAVLNAAVFAIAWIKPWRALNLLGFAFTFGIGTFWGALSYRPEFFASTEPFLLLFFAFYLLLPLLYALRLAPAQRDFVDGSLVFGTPLVALALQAALLDGNRMQLAWSAIGAAAIYTALAALEIRRFKLRLLGESHALLALGFATLAVPLALSARATACTFALEGVALVWLGLRQQRRVPRWIGYALQALAGFAFVFGYASTVDSRPILNGDFLGAVIIAFSGITCAYLLFRAELRAPLMRVLFAWGALWWYFAGGNEIEHHAALALRADWWLAFIAATALIAVEAYRRLDWRECVVPAGIAIPLGLPFIGLTLIDTHGPLEGWHIAAWVLWWAAATRSLPALLAVNTLAGRILHLIYLWILALLFGAELAHLADMHLHLSQVWIGLAALIPVAALFLLVLRRAQGVRWPLGNEAESLRTGLLGSLSVVLGIGWLIGLFAEGHPTPLPYVPVLNPLELAQIGFLVLLAQWYAQAEREGSALFNAEFRARVLALAGLALLTAITLRAVHFLGGVGWGVELVRSPLAQAALSIVWTLAGIAAMLIGKQRGSRAVWFGGAALMGGVLIKLLLIDRNYLHDLPAIVGVLVVGVLLVAVGYFAPVPPKLAVAGETR